MASLKKFTVVYYDESREQDVATIGQYELVQAQEHYGVEVTEAGLKQIELMNYAAWLSLKRSGKTPEKFSEWFKAVAATEPLEAEGESPTPPAQ